MPESGIFKLIIVTLFGFMPLIGSGQALLLSGSADDLAIVAEYTYTKVHPDSISAQQAINELVAALQKDGYFTAYTSPLAIKRDIFSAEIFPGRQYRWACLRPGNLDVFMQEKSGFREKFFLGKPFHYDEIAALYEKILKYAENKGYPFASVQLTNVQVTDHQVSATLKYSPGPLITFGELQIKGTEQVKTDFLEAYLGISTGQNYDERKVERIPALIRGIPYLTMTAPVAVTFQNETADVILTLSERKSNEIDGMLNFLPAEGKAGKFLLTGEVNILLNNLAKTGKQLELRWQRLQVQSERLALRYQYPNIFHSALHGGFHFSLLKEDTLFVNRVLSLTTGYPFGRGNRLEAGIKWQGSRLTGAGNRTVALADFDILSLEAGYERQQLDDAVFPGKGYVFSLQSGIGKKKMIPGIILSDGSSPESPAASWQQFFHAHLAQYHMLSGNWVLYHKLSGGWLVNNNLLLNDLYRLGGLHSLRGFYDNFFFASRYGLSNLELRLVFEQKPDAYSYIFAFYDQAVLLKNTIDETAKDQPAGLGAGINFTTPAGLFSLAYALGRSEFQDFHISLSRIHFGYISRF